MSARGSESRRLEVDDDYLTSLLQAGGVDGPNDDLSRSIRARCTDDLKPVHSLPASQRIALSLGLAVGLTLTFAFLTGYQPSGVAAAALYGVMAWALVQLGVLVAGFRVAHTLSPFGKVAVVVMVPAAFFLCLSIIAEHSAFAEFVSHAHQPRHMIKCGGFALSAGIVTALGIMFVWRRTDPFDPGFSGSIAGLVGGLAGALAVGLVCRDHGSWHLWLGHGLSVVALILVGRVIGRRLLAP